METDRRDLPETNNELTSEVVFSNQQIDLSALPTIEDIKYEKIQKTSLYVGIIVLIIVSVITLTGALLLVLFNDTVRDYYLSLFSIIVVAIAFLFLIEIKGFNKKGYAIREHDIIYKQGWIWTSVIAVPYNRIQHIEVEQGPIDRLFDLASVTLFTAGGSDVEIEGLLPDQANGIKEYIMSKNKELKKVTFEDESE
jgi:uncharacterized protein